MIQTTANQTGGTPWAKVVLATSLLVPALMAVCLMLAPTQEALASAFPGANGKIVFSSNRSTGTGVNNPEHDQEIFSMNPDGTALKQLTKNKAGQDIDPTYSSDGKKIAFRSDRTGDSEIFVMNSDGTGQKNLTNNPGNDLRPSFAADGKKMLFQSTRTGNSEIFVMNSDGTGQTDLTNDPASDFNATFSPKGDKIAFVSVRSGLDPEIFVMNSNGTGQTPLTANDALDDEPSFSPDGKKIAFKSSRDGSEDVFVMDASGANQTNITPNTIGVFDREPDWQPKAATFTVNTASDVGDGTCTLREAIDASNAVLGQIPNTIKFTIQGSGVQTITPSSPLPPITRPVVVDGYTQPGSSPNTLATGGTNAALKIELNGTNTSQAGLAILGTSNSVIRGLVINRFIGSEIRLGATTDNRIEGNFIGTDPTGTLGSPIKGLGVSVEGSNRNTVGGTTPGARNLISGNDEGIEFNSGAQGNGALGNLIGTTASGTAPLGNDDWGVAMFSPSTSNNKIGAGTAAGANTVAFNGKDGIEVDNNDSETGNQISRNSIFSNGGLGIDLIGGTETDDTNISTPNDAGDADTGADGLQNKPVISSAKTSSTKTTITGKLNSTPNKTFNIQLFSNPSGTNEGKKFIGQKSVTTDA